MASLTRFYKCYCFSRTIALFIPMTFIHLVHNIRLVFEISLKRRINWIYHVPGGPALFETRKYLSSLEHIIWGI
jgi:hypothetical protein